MQGENKLMWYEPIRFCMLKKRAYDMAVCEPACERTRSPEMPTHPPAAC